jgi:predicted histone-like DNA-binding protein
MAKYIKKEMADMRQTGVKQVCYRLKSNGTVDLGDLARRIARSSTFAEAEIKGVVLSLIEEVVDRMASGHSVHIDGLGTLTPKIGLREEAEPEVLDGEGRKRNARSLHVTGVSFKADKDFVRQLDSRCELEKGAVSRIRKSKYTEEQRLEKARAFLLEHTVMRLGDYYRLVGLSRTTASLELRKWDRDPATGIRSEGSYSAKVYVLRN